MIWDTLISDAVEDGLYVSLGCTEGLSYTDESVEVHYSPAALCQRGLSFWNTKPVCFMVFFAFLRTPTVWTSLNTEGLLSFKTTAFIVLLIQTPAFYPQVFCSCPLTLIYDDVVTQRVMWVIDLLILNLWLYVYRICFSWCIKVRETSVNFQFPNVVLNGSAERCFVGWVW